MRYIFVFLACSLVVGVVCAVTDGLVPVASIKRIIPIEDKLYREVEVPDVQPTDCAKGIHKVINNIDKIDGFSLSGYSSFTVDNNFNRQRWKFGFVGAEIEALRDKNTEKNRRIDHPEDFIDLEAKPVFGFHFVKEF